MEAINYKIAPLCLIAFLTPATQYLTIIGNPLAQFNWNSIVENDFAWIFVGITFVWALIWLLIPSKKFYGPPTTTNIPIYQANGEIYYFSTLSTFLIVAFLQPQLCLQIYENMGAIIGALNLVALGICFYLLAKGKLNQAKVLCDKNKSIIYDFYHGLELNPKLFGVDVKQLTNCRIGMMLWQILILSFRISGYQLNGFNFNHFVNFILQSFYIFMFFRWETGYFNTLDFIMDKTGWMLVWGCLVWIPSLYTFSSFFLIKNSQNLGYVMEIGILIVGILAIWFHSEADKQKELFKNAKGKSVKIWGKPAKVLRVSYKDGNGKEKVSQLLISGWWGVARKMNYSLDILSTLSWSICAGRCYGTWPYACWIFVTILLIHRVFRDEDKCKAKYGNGWEEYCSVVKYRMIPYIF